MSKSVLTAHLQDFNEQWLYPPLENAEVERVATSCNWCAKTYSVMEQLFPHLRKNLHIVAAKFHAVQEKSNFRFYLYQLTVQWQDLLRHGTCVV